MFAACPVQDKEIRLDRWAIVRAWGRRGEAVTFRVDLVVQIWTGNLLRKGVIVCASVWEASRSPVRWVLALREYICDSGKKVVEVADAL